MDFLNKMVSIVERIRTPLVLAGLVIIVLYALYKQIITMNIFATVSSEETFMLINSILLYLFVLAMISVILGTIGYVLSIQNSKKNK